jgi:hypothetical protein
VSYSRFWRLCSLCSRAPSGLATLLAVLTLLALLFALGCAGPRVVLVPDGEIVRIGPGVKGRVYVWDGAAWELSRNAVAIPEGWYAGSVREEEE